MGKHEFYECIWNIRHLDINGKVIWGTEHKNILVDGGEKAIIDSFFRDKDSIYFASANFYIGLYYGTMTEDSTLTTIPSEPSGYGYARQACERSVVGWPLIEQDDGDWRVVSKEISQLAVGGDIGPVNGAFIGTSLSNSGTLIGAVSFGVDRIILSGEAIYFQLKVKLK